MSDDKSRGYILAEKAGYSEAMSNAIILIHQIAGNKGVVGGEHEAMVDTWWATIPSPEKRNRNVTYGGEELSAQDAWVQADQQRDSKAIKTNPIERARVLDKLSILIDVLYEMDMLFRRPNVSKEKDMEW